MALNADRMRRVAAAIPRQRQSIREAIPGNGHEADPVTRRLAGLGYLLADLGPWDHERRVDPALSVPGGLIPGQDGGAGAVNANPSTTNTDSGGALWLRRA